MSLVAAFKTSCAGHIPAHGLLEKLQDTDNERACSLVFKGESVLDPQHDGFKLTSGDIQALCSVLIAEPNSIKELHLQNVGISDSDCSNIAELLEKNSALEVLNLRGSDMSSAGLSQLTPSVSQSKTLKGLNLHGCKVGSGNGMLEMVEGLGRNTQSVLKELDVSSTDLSIDSLIQLRTLVCQHGSSLQKLVLDRPLLKDPTNDFAPHVGDILKHTKTLEHLSVRHFGFTDEGMDIIAAGLARSSIRVLDLGGNRIGRDGATRIATALTTNTTLKKLSLDHNQIQDEGLLAICAALLQSPGLGLEMLNVSFNGILGAIGHKTGHLYHSGLVYLAQTIASTPSLTEFYIWGNPAVSAVGQLDNEAALMVSKLLVSGNYITDVCAYEVDGTARLALQN